MRQKYLLTAICLLLAVAAKAYVTTWPLYGEVFVEDIAFADDNTTIVNNIGDCYYDYQYCPALHIAALRHIYPSNASGERDFVLVPTYIIVDGVAYHVVGVSGQLLGDDANTIKNIYLNNELEFLGSSCIYPRMAPQPMTESCLLTGELEKTNEAYALAKISGLKYCEFLNRQYGTDYISVMPTNLYGPNDNYHPTHSHVLPALIRRFHEAKESGAESVTCWGDGSPLREFLYVDDLANLCVFLMNNYSGNETVNAGTGKELTIKELTELVAKVIGYEGQIEWDTTKPNGTPRKLLDVSKATALGWTYKTELEDGIRLSYQDFLTNPMRAER